MVTTVTVITLEDPSVEQASPGTTIEVRLTAIRYAAPATSAPGA